MAEQLLDPIPLSVLALATFLVVMISLDLGFRLGRWRRDRSGEEHDTTLAGVVGATLGLVAFLLAFTFGMAASRFEDRRQVLLEEVNALRTAYLRADLIEEPYRSATHRILREYVDLRLQEANARTLTSDMKRPESLHRELWNEVVQFTASSQLSGEIQGSFVASIGLVIDAYTKRTEMARHRIPTTIWLALYLITIVAMANVGYQSGVSALRRSPAIPALAVSFCVVLALIADLDRPLQGLLRISQRAMTDLQQEIAPNR
jgi:hypothetical protein